MSIATVRAQLAALQIQIPGINYSYAQLPRGRVPDMNLPLFLNFVRNADYNYVPLGSDDVETSRIYLMWLLLQPVSEGEEGEGEALVEPFISVISDFFIARPSLENLTYVKTSTLLDDSGPKRMIWPGTPTAPQGVYWGAEFRLNVVEIAHIDYVDY